MSMPVDHRLIRLLQDHSLLCPGCEYDLHRLKESVCPECGERLTLRTVVRKNFGRKLRAIEYGIPLNFLASLGVFGGLSAASAVGLSPFAGTVVSWTIAVILTVMPIGYLVLALLALDSRELRVANKGWRRRVLLFVWSPLLMSLILAPIYYSFA